MDRRAFLLGILMGGGASSGGSDEQAELAKKPVKYIDCDGTILYGYSVAEFARLSEHPANPERLRLTAQGWNWSLADAQEYVNTYGQLVIGQVYTPTSGKTEIDIELINDDYLSPYIILRGDENNTVTITWGDGSTDTITFDEYGHGYVQHVYNSTGKYTILIDGECAVANNSEDGQVSLLSDYSTNTYSVIYTSMIKAIRFGTNISNTNGSYQKFINLEYVTIPNNSSVTISSFAFRNCYKIKGIVLPDGIATIGTYAFHSCVNLKYIALPASITLVNDYAFAYCTQLKVVTLPDGVTNIPTGTFMNTYCLETATLSDDVTNISAYGFYQCYQLQHIKLPDDLIALGNYAFQNCYQLEDIIIPSYVTSLGTSAFANCTSMKAYHLLSNEPPTLHNVNTFTGIDDNTIIYVPAASLTTYQSTSNWITYANHMKGEGGK